MKERIFEAIKLQHGKVSFKNLHKKFDIDEDGLKKVLLELKKDGMIIQKGNKYDLFPNDNYVGTVNVVTNGRKFIFHDENKIMISREHGKDVLLHDIVSYKINDKNEAEVTSIIDRTLGKMTCEVVVTNGKKKIVPYHEGVEVTLHDSDLDRLLDGDIILVDLTSTSLDDYCDAKYIKTIAHRDDPNKLELMTALNYGFDNDYSDEFLLEVNSLPKSVSDDEIETRVDYRYQNSFTIDCVNTKDMDDGVYAEMLDNNLIRVYVHISDVSHYVKPGMHLFKRACDKTTSAYINNSVFHMLHHIISNGICSLNPYEDRLTKTVVMDINEDGEIVNYDIVKSVINSKKKMNYEDVDKVLDYNYIPDGYENYVDTLHLLNEVSHRLDSKYHEEGKIEFATFESDHEYNSDGSIKNFGMREEGSSAKLIENLMIAANRTVANWLYWSNLPSVYRVLEMPRVKKVNEAIEEIRKSGFKFKYINNVDSPRVIQKLFDSIANTPEFPIISGKFISCMQRARYDTENIGHYALGANAYTHFTSPIRRLPDLLVHHIIDLILVNYHMIDTLNFERMESDLRYLCARASTMERQADTAERDGELTLIIDKMDKMARNGEEYFEALVCGVDKNIHVLINTFETYVNPEELGSNFKFDSSRKLFYDIDNGLYLKLGVRILVKLRSVNTSNRTVKLSILSVIPQEEVLDISEINAKRRILSK